MKHIRNWLCMVLVIAAIFLLAVPAYAADTTEPEPYAFPPNYGPASYSTTQSGNRLISKVSLAKNPDRAAIRIKQEVQSGDFRYPMHSGSSARGAMSYTLSSILENVAGYPPTVAYITYEVYQGDTYEAVAWYGRCELS